MRLSEQELAIEVRKINSIEIDHVNVAKASSDQVLEQLTANATSTDYKYPRL